MSALEEFSIQGMQVPWVLCVYIAKGSVMQVFSV
jgi:hypothetical protein